MKKKPKDYDHCQTADPPPSRFDIGQRFNGFLKPFLRHTKTTDFGCKDHPLGCLGQCAAVIHPSYADCDHCTTVKAESLWEHKNTCQHFYPAFLNTFRIHGFLFMYFNQVPH